MFCSSINHLESIFNHINEIHVRLREDRKFNVGLKASLTQKDFIFESQGHFTDGLKMLEKGNCNEFSRQSLSLEGKSL